MHRKTTSNCVIVQDIVPVSVIVSEILLSEHFPLNVCQWHKSRSRSSEVTVGVMSPLDLPRRQIWSVYLTRRPCSGSRNTVHFHKAPEIRGDSAYLYLENSKLYEINHSNEETSLALLL